MIITSAVSCGPAHHFAAADGTEAGALALAAEAPLSVMVQVTRRCNFACSFCSEMAPARDPTLAELEGVAANIRGVPRVFQSRGERGGYDSIMRGIGRPRRGGDPGSLSAVVLRPTLIGLPFTYQIADVVGAGKLKMILPLRKGNAMALPEAEPVTRSGANAVPFRGRRVSVLVNTSRLPAAGVARTLAALEALLRVVIHTRGAQPPPNPDGAALAIPCILPKEGGRTGPPDFKAGK